MERKKDIMNFQAILHIPKSNYAYPYTPKDFHVRLRTAKDDIDRVTLVIGNQYLWQTRKPFEMEKIGSDEFYDYYQYDYHCDDTRLGYYFELTKGEEEIIYSEAGFAKKGEIDIDKDRIGFIHFQFPFINAIDVHKKPSWVNETVFYQIFVERFCNGDPDISPEELQEWGTLPNRKSFFGGDLKGITQKLDYLVELGINALYLTPIFEASSNHKYDTIDYTRIDPHFGDEESLRELVKKAHEKGIRIMLDGVFNHSGYYFHQFQDVLRNGENSPYKDWFHIRSFPVTIDPPNYDGFAVGPYMPKLNTSNPECKNYLLEAVKKWTRTGIDGWRLDVADEVDSFFWRDFRKEVRKINPEAIIIGEDWWNSEPWLRGDQFDGVMNYAVQKAAILYTAEDRMSPMQFQNRLMECLMRNTTQANDSMLNLLDSHDTPRFEHTCGGNKNRLKNAAVFQYSYIGMPCTYYGTEIGMEGDDDPDCRRTFDWNRDNWDMELFRHYQKLISIRKNKQVLQYGKVRFCSTDTVFALERKLPLEKILTAINNTAEPQSYVADSTRAVKDLLTDRVYDSENGQVTVELPPYSSVMLEFPNPYI